MQGLLGCMITVVVILQVSFCRYLLTLLILYELYDLQNSTIMGLFKDFTALIFIGMLLILFIFTLPLPEV